MEGRLRRREPTVTLTQVALAISEHAWSLTWTPVGCTVVGTLSWFTRRVFKSRSAESLDRTLAGSVEVKGLSRSLRQEGVPDAERHQLIIEVWRRNLDLHDPPST
jgi:hypothetical protein